MCRHQLLSQFTNRVIPFQKNGNCHGSNNDRHFKQTTNYCKPLNHSRSSIFQLLLEPLFYRLTIFFFFANPWNKRKFTIFLYKQIQLSNIVALKKKKNKLTKLLFVYISIQFKFNENFFFIHTNYTNFWTYYAFQSFVIHPPFSPDLQFFIKNALNIQAIVPYNFRGQPYVF